MKLLLVAVLLAQDWPQWRGPNRDDVVRGVTLPVAWPKRLQLKWKTAVGEGYSSPVVAQGAAYVHAREGDQEVVSRIDRESGKLVWRKSYTASFTQNQYAVQMARGPHSTPVVWNGRVYTLGVTAIVSAWDARTGDLIWRKDCSRQQDTSKLFTGTAMSPLVEGGAVIVHLGDDRGGRVLAFDAASGRERWRWEGDGPGYASPVVIEIDGVRQIVMLTDRSIIGVDAAEGKLLWTIPYKDEWIENIVTPVVWRHTLIFSGVRKPTTAVRVKQSGGRWTTEAVWSNDSVSMYMSTPVVDGDYLYGFSQKKKGQFFCLDLDSGKATWMSEGRSAHTAAVMGAGDVLFFLTDSADLIVARKSPQKLEEISRYSVADSATFAHPVILNKQILVRDAKSLALWQVP